MKFLSFCFALFSYIPLALAWMEVPDSNDKFVTSDGISTLFYSAGISFISWTQADANTLCTSGECGPYCNYTSSDCVTTNTRDFTNIPSASGTTDGLTNQDAGCPETCCSTENCLRTLNLNGDAIGINKEYVLIFGGKLVNATDSTTSLYDICEFDFFQVDNNDSCLGTPSNDIFMADIDEGKTMPIVLTYNSDLTTGVTQPSARYGHQAVLVTRTGTSTSTSFTYQRKYMYIYGGYSPDCGGYCNDIWRYEIPFAPQRYYPDDSGGYWKRGNYWRKMTTSTNPGNRSWFSMVSDGTENIYMFGGVKQLTNGSRIFTNDLWKYSASTGIWTQLTVQKISSIKRSVQLWDGTWQNIYGNINEIKNGDIIEVAALSLTDCIVDSSLPPCMGFTSLSYDGANNRLILSGGFNSDLSEDNYMSYVWSFDFTLNLWSPYDIGSDIILVPGAPSFASNTFIATSTYSYQFYFGGIISETENRNSLWAYDFVMNKSSELNPQPFSSTQDYPQLNKGMTLIKLTKNPGLFLFGGYLRNTLDSTLNTTKVQYLEQCSSVLEAAGLRLSDSFSSVWQEMYESTKSACFASQPQFYIIENMFTISNKMWTYMQDYCGITDYTYGNCYWGRANCTEDHYGSDCSNLLCINSFCYQEKTSLDEAVCIHCYARGQCLNGECQCEVGYTYDDCSGVGCANNCSNTATLTVATCIQTYPLSVCQCETSTKRGGDDCSYIFCLNDCGGHGDCVDGVCECDTNYYGEDCSIFYAEFIGDTASSYASIGMAPIPMILLLFIIFLTV